MNRFRRATIFLAEDNPDDIEIARRAFKRAGLGSELIVARDGEEALRLLADERLRPDFVLLDIKLPKIDGFEVLAQIRASERHAALPVVVMSASSREEDVLRSYQLGGNSYVQKPVVFQEFMEALEIMGSYWFKVARLPRSR
ncbi:MAG TPA: response regulator [Dehalococcoidia bacterium]